MRVALDTNVLVSAVATRGLCADVFNLGLAEHGLIVGETVLSELRRVLAEHIRVPSRTIEELVSLLRQEAEVVKKTDNFPVKIRDKDDLAVLSEAIAGSAEALVTGDRDLLEIKEELPLRLLSPRAFWELLREGNPPRYKRRLTSKFSGRGLTCQHAGARRPQGHSTHSPAAEHFMCLGPL